MLDAQKSSTKLKCSTVDDSEMFETSENLHISTPYAESCIWVVQRFQRNSAGIHPIDTADVRIC